MSKDTPKPSGSTCHPSGGGLTVKDTILETGASFVQNFAPIKSICAHLNAFHVYASDPTRSVESNHYCTHLSPDVRQCLVYDVPKNPARLIGVEYLITRRLYDDLPREERVLWHSHDYEVCARGAEESWDEKAG